MQPTQAPDASQQTITISQLGERVDFIDTVSEIVKREWGHLLQPFGIFDPWDFRILKRDTSRFLVAHSGDMFVGMICLEDTYSIAKFRKQYSPCLCFLWVEAEWRNMGVGGLLLEVAVKAIKVGAEKSFLWCKEEEMRWFELKGWRVEEEWRYAGINGFILKR